MKPMTRDEIRGLSDEALLLRMDEFLGTLYRERMPNVDPSLSQEFLVSNFTSTKTFQSYSEEERRELMWRAFELLLQRAISMQYFYMHSMMPQAIGAEAWADSATRMVHYAAIGQSVGISSRSCFECAMQLIYYIDKKSRLKEKKKSLFKAFVAFLQEKGYDSSYRYFVYYLEYIRKWEGEYRTPEVHASGKWKSVVLQMSDNTQEYYDELLALHNILFSISQATISILDERRPNSGTLFSRDDDSNWVSDFALQKTDEIKSKTDEIFARLSGE